MQGAPNAQSGRVRFWIGIVLCLVLPVFLAIGALRVYFPYKKVRLESRGKGVLELRTRKFVLRSRAVAEYVPLEEIPPPLIRALLYQEDRGFYRHRGYSPREMARALWDYLVLDRPARGASTLTQQLARTLFLSRKKTLRRKLLELRIARVLENRLSKGKILELYVNHVYWGKNRSGLARAAAYYFHKPAAALGVEESVLLVSILPNPDACRTIRRCTRGAEFRRARLRKFLKRRHRSR